MKLKIIFFGVLLILSTLTTKAQKADTVTREEMARYVVMMDSVEVWKKFMAETNTRLAKGNEKITATRYNTLLPLISDQKKLEEAKATADEISYLKKAMETRNVNARNFQAVFTSLMSTTGEATYKKVSKAVSADPKTREWYNAELNKLNRKSETGQ